MRVQKAKLSFDYVEFVRAKKFAVRNGTYEPADLADVRNRYQALISQSQSFGITYFGEGNTLEEWQDENKNFAHVKPYPVKRLENSSLLLHIVPGLSGRVIQMIDKRTGHDALVLPAPEDGRYPDGGGLGVFVFARFGRYTEVSPYTWEDYDNLQRLFRELLEVKWELDADSPKDQCVLTGACSNGLTLKRTIQIPAERVSVHTETHAQNAGNGAIEVALLSVFSANPTQGLAPEEMDNVSIAFSTQGGKTIEKRLIDPALEAVGADTYTGSSQPDGEWRMVNPKPGLMLVNRFNKVQVERCFLRWSAKNQNSVSLALLSPKRRLEPGESMRLDADYSLGK